MLRSSPGRAAAIVVGVDSYDYGDEWNLAGPAADALRCVEWLVAREIDPENVALFLSPASWADKEVKAWKAERPRVRARVARRDDVVHFIDRELPELDVDSLFLFWGGHGVVDDLGQRNYLFTADAAEGIPYCVCIQDLMSALKGPRFAHLAEQVAIVDACANPFDDVGETAQPSAAAFAISKKAAFEAKQFVMMSASAGNRAANLSDRRSGLFSQAIFAELDRHTMPSWPDFQAVFSAALLGVEARGLGRQHPFVCIDWEGARQVSRRPAGASDAVRSLRPLIDATAASPAVIRRVYARSHPDPSRALDSATIEGWLMDLDDTRARTPTSPPPLIEFAERLARELGDGAIRQWVKDRTSRTLNARTELFATLDAEAGAERQRATLFITVDQQGRTIRWVLDAPDPTYRGAAKGELALQGSIDDLDDLRSAVAAGLKDAMAAVEEKAGHRFQPMVSFILPDTLLLSGLESIGVAFDDEGLAGDIVALNERYPVTLHWNRRVAAGNGGGGRAVNAWKRALEMLQPRIAGGWATSIVWPEPSAADSEALACGSAARALLAHGGNGICVGLDDLGTGTETFPKTVVCCLKEGVPCFFWLGTPTKADPEVRKALSRLFSRHRASDLPVAVRNLRLEARVDDPLRSIRVVWDEPGYLPTPTLFEVPADGSAP